MPHRLNMKPILCIYSTNISLSPRWPVLPQFDTFTLKMQTSCDKEKEFGSCDSNEL